MFITFHSREENKKDCWECPFFIFKTIPFSKVGFFYDCALDGRVDSGVFSRLSIKIDNPSHRPSSCPFEECGGTQQISIQCLD